MKKILLFAFFISSCQSNKENESLKNDNLVKQRVIDEQQRQINSLQERLTTLESHSNDQNVEGIASFSNSQYYFIVLQVSEERFSEGEQHFYFVTQINEIMDYNENLKYKLLDDVVLTYKNSSNASLFNGSVKKRNIYLFSSYQEASKAREKYVID